MELKKYQAPKVTYQIKHNLRCLPEGKNYGNESIISDLTPNNYSLIDRGKSAEDVMKYRRDFEKKVFRYNRKNIVRAVELIIQRPADCPPEQRKAFFQASFEWYCDNFLPAQKDCVLTAEVHRDEHHYTPTGEMISKEHLHILYVPAVEDKKHDGYQYRLCADELTRKATLKKMHPSLQKELDDRGIHATVYKKKATAGKSIPLSTSQLKEITRLTGVTIDCSMTVDELSRIISENIQLRSVETTCKQLEKQLRQAEQEIENLKTKNAKITQDKDWGFSSGWGSSSSWGNTKKTFL